MPKGRASLRAIASRDAELGACINEIWRLASKLQWDQRGSTTQGREHCERVEENALRLLEQVKPRSVCTPTVAFIISAAAALHDVGKILRGPSAPKPLPDHGAESRRRILENAIGIPFPDLEFQNIIADVVGVHATKEPFSSVPAKSRQCNGQEVWPRSLAAVFRLADMLDTTGARAPAVYCQFRGALYERHREVWLARGSITGWTCDDDGRKILLQALPSTPEAARAVETLVRLTNADLHTGHKKALASLQFGRTTTRRPPIVIRLPTKFSLVQSDRKKVRELAQQFPRGYVIHDRTIIVKPLANARFAVEETFYIAALQPIDQLTILAAAPPVSVSRLLVANKLMPAKFLGRAVEVPRSIKEDDLTKVEIWYEATERVLRIDPKLAVFNSATLTLRGLLGPTTNVSAFDFPPNGPRTPTAAVRDERSEDGEFIIEYRISAADPARVYEFRW